MVHSDNRLERQLEEKDEQYEDLKRQLLHTEKDLGIDEMVVKESVHVEKEGHLNAKILNLEQEVAALKSQQKRP